MVVQSIPDLTPLGLRCQGNHLTFVLRRQEDILDELPADFEVVLADRLRGLLADEQPYTLEVDLESIAGLTSRQLGSLIALGKVLRARFGAIPMRGVSAGVRHLLDLTRTSALFDMS